MLRISASTRVAASGRIQPVPRATGSLTSVANPTAAELRKSAPRRQVGRRQARCGRERRFSIVAAVLSVLFGLLIYFSETHDKSFRLAKGQLTPQTTLLLAIVCGVLLLGATYLGRRAPVGFVALFTFLMFGTSTLPLGLPFLALAGWLLYRSYKAQKEATPATSGRPGRSLDHDGGPDRNTAGGNLSDPRRVPARRDRPRPRPTSATHPSAHRRRRPSPHAGSARRQTPPIESGAGRPAIGPTPVRSAR